MNSNCGSWVKDVKQGTHYKALAQAMAESQYRDDFAELGPINIYSKLDMDDRFLLIGRGIFIAVDNFDLPDKELIVNEAREILKEAGTAIDSAFILNKLKERLPHVPSILKYALSSVLKTTPGFTSVGKLVVGLHKHGAESAEQIADILYKVIDASLRPLPASIIYSRFSEIRGNPKHVVLKTLSDDKQFIRFSQGVYGLRKHIPFNDGIIHTVHQACRERILADQRPITLNQLLRYVSYLNLRPSYRMLQENLMAILALSFDFSIKGYKISLKEF